MDQDYVHWNNEHIASNFTGPTRKQAPRRQGLEIYREEAHSQGVIVKLSCQSSFLWEINATIM